MNDTLRAQLDQIEKWLMEPGGRELADVLSALRGPDTPESPKLKKKMTVPIRRAAFPKIAELHDLVMSGSLQNDVPRLGWSFGRIAETDIIPQFDSKVTPQDWEDDFDDEHFRDHAIKAAVALGIKE